MDIKLLYPYFISVYEWRINGVVNRKVYNEVPPKVEYSLSEEGETLREILNMMCAWGDRRMGNNPNCS